MLEIHTFATRNEGDVGCCLRVLEDKERGISEEKGCKKALRKKLQNKFGVSRKCFYLCSPNKNGEK
jgi:hypothetical protein